MVLLDKRVGADGLSRRHVLIDDELEELLSSFRQHFCDRSFVD